MATSRSARKETFVLAIMLIEFDPELKSHGFTDQEKPVVFEDLAPILSVHKNLPQSVITMAAAKSKCRKRE